MKKILITLLMFLVTISNVYASSISRLDLTILPDKSEYIILGKVINVRAMDARDVVTVKVAASLKGKLKMNEVTFILTARGGLKYFDPQLSIGDTGVFFLIEENGTIKKSYWGSIAIFTKKIFY